MKVEHWGDVFYDAIGTRIASVMTDEQKSNLQPPDTIAMEIKFAADHLGLSLTDLVVMPELDSWKYATGPDSDARVFAQGSFVVSALQALGVFDDDIEINANEFTVKDVY